MTTANLRKAAPMSGSWSLLRALPPSRSRARERYISLSTWAATDRRGGQGSDRSDGGDIRARRGGRVPSRPSTAATEIMKNDMTGAFFHFHTAALARLGLQQLQGPAEAPPRPRRAKRHGAMPSHAMPRPRPL